MHIIQIAQSFSIGEFESTFQHLSAHVVWDIIGQQQLVGIDEVKQHCLSIQQYFASTEHHFKIINAFQCDERCIVQGSAKFISPDSVSQISACDVYTFDTLKKLIKIESYCISVSD